MPHNISGTSATALENEHRFVVVVNFITATGSLPKTHVGQWRARDTARAEQIARAFVAKYLRPKMITGVKVTIV